MTKKRGQAKKHSKKKSAKTISKTKKKTSKTKSAQKGKIEETLSPSPIHTGKYNFTNNKQN